MTSVSADADDRELARITALDQLDILDTPAEQAFDQITRLAALVFGAESSGVTLVDSRRAWFKSRHGLDLHECARDEAFCTYTLDSPHPMIVPDLRADPRFAAHPLVASADGVRFYAGAPLVTRSGHHLGALCVMDGRPRGTLNPGERQALLDLAALAVDLIETRRLRQVGEIATQVVDATPDAVLCTDADGQILFWNAAAERMFGHAAADAIGRSVDLIVPARMKAAHAGAFRLAAAGGGDRFLGGSIELPALRSDGSEFPVELSLARWGAAGGSHGFAAIIRDTSTRQQLERARAQAQSFLDIVVEHLPAMLFVKDSATRRYLLINRAGETLVGRPRDSVIGRTDRELFPQEGADYERRDDEALADIGATRLHESEFLRDDGQPVSLRTKRIIIDGPDRPRQYVLGLSEDVTEIRRAEAEVLRLAHFDSLTGLVNRHSYVDRLHELMAAGTGFALLAVDLDRFKAVNDQFGHLVGDSVLAEVGDRLQALIEPSDIVARVGGDEFVVLVIEEHPASRARRVAEAIVRDMARPYLTGRGTAYLGASVGIVLAPSDAGTTQEIRHCADLALYRAKNEGRGTICFYKSEMDDRARDRQMLEVDLRSAIERGAITLCYQPVLAARTGQIVGAEALARWTHPERGPIRPDLFIAVAEECGLIAQLGRWLLESACADAMTWPADVSVAVNLSPLQFHGDDLFGTVMHALKVSGLPAHRLQLEVTESLVIRDVERTFVELERLRAVGIQILMDDFGTGYSSLSYFERFPFDKIKIDQSFVRGLNSSVAAGAIIKAIVGLGEALGMGIIAEGVETERQMAALVSAGCTHLQGYLFSQPVASERIAALLASTQPTLAVFAEAGMQAAG